MMKSRKRIDSKARIIHERIASRVRAQMALRPKGRQGVMAVAKDAGIGIGSVQSILNDPDHSPSVRVLNHLVELFGLPGIGALTDGDECA